MSMHAEDRKKNLVDPDRLLRVDMLGNHETSWLVSAHRDGCQIEWPVLLAYLTEHRAIAGVPGKVEACMLCEDCIAAPKAGPPV